MAVKQPWFVVERAEALAVIALTRRDDLEVIPTPRQNYDLLVRINDTRPASEPRFFVVETRGLEQRSRAAARAKEGIFPVEYSPLELSGEGLPVCTFLFLVDQTEGYYRWLHEPTVNHNGLAVLRLDQEIPRLHDSLDALRRTINIRVDLKFTPLDNEAIDMIVMQVAKWYEAKQQHRHPLG